MAVFLCVITFVNNLVGIVYYLLRRLV